MSTGTIVLIVVIAIVVLIIAFFAGTYNGLIKKKNAVEESFSTMDVYMKKRWDLIPNIVASVKGYAKHEAETLQNVISARARNYSSLSDDEKISANTELSHAVAGFNAVAERYPELKANENFMNLQNQLNRVEEDIANSRKFYNATVKEYNNKVEMFPSNIIASMTGFKKKSMFLIDDEAQRENVKVEF